MKKAQINSASRPGAMDNYLPGPVSVSLISTGLPGLAAPLQ